MNQELREGNEAATNPDPSLAQQEAARDINESAADKRSSAGRAGDTELAALFAPEIAKDFRCQWDAVQSSFVEEPDGNLFHRAREARRSVRPVGQGVDGRFAACPAPLSFILRAAVDAVVPVARPVRPR